MCSAMLSERVVLVLSKQYVQETWFVFEKILRQLTQMSLHNQRIMGVLLEDCDIPDTLGELYFLDTSDPDFFDVFIKRLKTGEDAGEDEVRGSQPPYKKKKKKKKHLCNGLPGRFGGF